MCSRNFLVNDPQLVSGGTNLQLHFVTSTRIITDYVNDYELIFLVVFKDSRMALFRYVYSELTKCVTTENVFVKLYLFK